MKSCPSAFASPVSRRSRERFDGYKTCFHTGDPAYPAGRLSWQGVTLPQDQGQVLFRVQDAAGNQGPIASRIANDTLQITPEIFLGLTDRIDEFKSAWLALSDLSPDRLSALRRIVTSESIGSSTRIEGSNPSDREVDRLLSTLTSQSFDTRDAQELAGCAELMDLVFSSWPDIPFNENHAASGISMS